MAAKKQPKQRSRTRSAVAKKRTKPSIMEVLRAIRDKMSLEVMNMTHAEREAYYAEGSKWFTDRMIPVGSRKAKRATTRSIRLPKVPRVGSVIIRRSLAKTTKTK